MKARVDDGERAERPGGRKDEGRGSGGRASNPKGGSRKSRRRKRRKKSRKRISGEEAREALLGTPGLSDGDSSPAPRRDYEESGGILLKEGQSVVEDEFRQEEDRLVLKKRGDYDEAVRSGRIDPYAGVYWVLMDDLWSDEDVCREGACFALGELRYKMATRMLARMLSHDPSVFVRQSAAVALRRIGGSGAVQALIRGLKDEDPFVRETCIYALEYLHDEQAVYPLEQYVKEEEDPHLRFIAETALDQLKGRPLASTPPVERKIFKYKRQISREPDNATAYYNLGVAYFHARRFDEARECCRKARELGANVQWLEDRLAELSGAAPAKEDEVGDDSSAGEARVEAPAETAGDEAEAAEAGGTDE